MLLFAEVGRIIIDFASIYFFNKGVTTLTEEEKNAQAQADKETEENDDLKVVMPEANKTTMPKEEFKEQPDYLKVFANFYIAQFDEDDLEIINLYDEKHNMVDINSYLLNNLHFPRKKLIDHVLQYHDYNFKNLLDVMIEKTGVKPEDMLTYEAWDKWYEEQRAKISSSLS
ncbi:hypothetical protein LHEH8_12240 [Lactobacillus helveticus]|uniref:Uncharacterized protein n=1 Tax=Lactobacillus helveticus TaxID=1587 RepID=A0A8H9KHG3_LACHE|nr:hypothetical protein IV62_GL001176 [Lactobacillus helveticus]GFO99468.1 hypothetical protein LHEH8_12240 [Lactobacillus helveticus]GFP01952.1 hypothetical protein LHEW6_17850 [Lactobacillus helveticus]GFP02791.1 hypothetical protein LHEY10_07200 [Lactobacillus helveticus]GFP05497.1 hypothetical protein LMG22465_15100 [Lactobacillus helveticus]